MLLAIRLIHKPYSINLASIKRNILSFFCQMCNFFKLWDVLTFMGKLLSTGLVNQLAHQFVTK